MEELISHCRSETEREHLSALHRALTLFKEYWFCRDAKVTNKRLIEFALNFNHIVSIFCNRKQHEPSSKIMKFDDIPFSVKIKYEDPKASDIIGFYVCLQKYDVGWIRKTFRIPRIKNDEDEQKKYDDAQSEALRAWTWFREHYSPADFEKQFPELKANHDIATNM